MKLAHGTLSGFAIVATMLAGSERRSPMHLGNFSISLTVKNVQASKDFYGKLEFVQILGNAEQGWAIMKNGSTNIGLFHGASDRNMLTFNPRWGQDGKPDETFEDIRTIQARLKRAGIDAGADIEGAQGPASFTITDPDGNPVLFDQHV